MLADAAGAALLASGAPPTVLTDVAAAALLARAAEPALTPVLAWPLEALFLHLAPPPKDLKYFICAGFAQKSYLTWLS